ncbi:MAG TPA: DUF2110 family protein [Candidatus Limnocylindrales bacterium]|nr:DUF2110 family protein [Candidatus Limnocylindrales bacterium]
MTVLTLLVKVRSSAQLKLVDDLLKAEFENLDLDFKVLGADVNRWVQVSISGEDEVLATNYIGKEIGACPVSIKKIKKFSVLKGFITKLDTAKNELAVDVGVFEPRVTQAAVSLAHLQAQLADGRKTDLKKIAEAYGFEENLPLEVKVVNLGGGGEDGRMQAELSTAQIEKLLLWQRSLLDRLIVLGVTAGDVETVLERTRLNRDVIGTERLGLFEYALTCKLGTDAAGLIPRIGRYMRNAVFVVFNPKKTMGVIGEKPLNL